MAHSRNAMPREQGAERSGLAAEAEEYAGRPQRGATQEGHCRQRGEQERVSFSELVDRKQRPHGWEEHHQQVRGPERGAAGEDQGAPQQGDRGPPGDYLVGEQPAGISSQQIDDDRAQPTEVQAPGDGPPEEVGLVVALIQERAEPGDPQGDRRLQERGMKLGDVGQRVCPSQRATRSR